MQKLVKHLARALEWALIAVFLATLSAGILQVVNRYSLGFQISWTEEVQRYLHIWLIFLAIPLAIIRGSHLSLQIIPLDRISPWLALMQRLLVKLLWLGLGLILIVAGWRVVAVASNQIMPALEISMSYAYLAPVVGGLVIVLVIFLGGEDTQSAQSDAEVVERLDKGDGR